MPTRQGLTLDGVGRSPKASAFAEDPSGILAFLKGDIKYLPSFRTAIGACQSLFFNAHGDMVFFPPNSVDTLGVLTVIESS